MNIRNFTELPDVVAPGSYVKISPMRDGSFCVATYDPTSPITVKLTGRWFGASEGEAHLVAMQLQARGYEWRRA